MLSRTTALLSLLVATHSFAEPSAPPIAWALYESHPGHYLASRDTTMVMEGSASALLQSDGPQHGKFGALLQAVIADDYQGKRVRLSAQLRTEAADRAWIWLRADRADGTVVAFDNMHDRPIQGDTDWTLYEVVLDIPADAVVLAYGSGLRGSGKVWSDILAIETVPDSVPTTRPSAADLWKPPMPEESLARTASNLDFEQ